MELLPADWYLRAFLSLTVLTEILHSVQNDEWEAGRKARNEDYKLRRHSFIIMRIADSMGSFHIFPCAESTDFEGFLRERQEHDG